MKVDYSCSRGSTSSAWVTACKEQMEICDMVDGKRAQQLGKERKDRNGLCQSLKENLYDGEEIKLQGSLAGGCHCGEGLLALEGKRVMSWLRPLTVLYPECPWVPPEVLREAGPECTFGTAASVGKQQASQV